MAKKSKSSFGKLSGLKASETNENRDVYEDQQLDRSTIEDPRSKTSRRIVAIVAGVLATVLVWLIWSAGHWGMDAAAEQLDIEGSGSNGEIAGELSIAPGDYVVRDAGDGMFSTSTYYHLDAEGEVVESEPFDSEDAAVNNPPQWVLDAEEQASGEAVEMVEEEPLEDFTDYLMHITMLKLLVALGVGLATFGMLYTVLMRNLAAQNLMNETSDVMQHQGDQHIAVPEEVQRKFSWFPDVGAHSSVQPSSMISHVMLTNKGLHTVQVSQRAQKDIYDADGDLAQYKGEVLRHDDGRVKSTTQPIIDESFGDALFDASKLPHDKALRKKYDATKIEYNPGGTYREKTGKYDTVADLIKNDWTMPWFEVQRPGGAYIVDESPVNTMVLAITRAGKGQTYIEPMIDMWLREKNPNNMVINDPKGELLVKHYVRATMRGYQVVQFNLINSPKTDIYNPLAMAAEAARAGDITKCAMYVENIANVFFPLDGGDDPVWPNAANNAFKRAAYGLIDYFMEEERELRNYAQRTGMNPKVLQTKLDEQWGRVTLYNCYQLFVRLSAKKMKNPLNQLKEDLNAGVFGEGDDIDREAYEQAQDDAEAQSFMWEGNPELDMLTLYFNATNGLPQNSVREQVANADNALRSMAAAEKMLASVYGIAITAMSFFTDPTIRRLTSGRPSQNIDFSGMSFPRQLGVRFHANYLSRDNLSGAQAKWTTFTDPMFTQMLEGEDFEHEDTISPEGWARYYFKGVFPQRTVYPRLQLFNSQTGMILRTFYFKFTKDYVTSLDGRRYITDPILGTKVIKDGVLLELRAVNEDGGEVRVGEQPDRFIEAPSTYPQVKLTNLMMSEPEKVQGRVNAITSESVRYSESPRAVFLVTPPHLMKYAKLILILVKQLVDLNFDQSYMTKSNQKPLYKTRFMLDELGNLQSEGHGISGFETMLSIGLGQEQQFTIILQTLQQLKEVYGDSVDKIVQGNTANIVFLKSTDDSMIETLEKMSGKTHKAYIDSKTVTKDVGAVVKLSNVEDKASYTMSAKEEPVIKYNDMAFLAERNSIVFRAGDPPVWNRNQTILPMSFRLFKDTIIHPGHDYTMQTLPTLSTARDFDVRSNTPDFEAMLSKRMKQAETAVRSREIYQSVFEYSDLDISRLDPDVYADEVMELVDVAFREEHADQEGFESPDEVNPMLVEHDLEGHSIEEDQQQKRELQRLQAEKDMRDAKIYAGKRISQEMLVSKVTGPTHSFDSELIETFKALGPQLGADDRFRIGGDGSLLSADGSKTYIAKLEESEAQRQAKTASESESDRVYAEDEDSIMEMSSYEVSEAFYRLLSAQDSWLDIAEGEFDKEMAKQYDMREELSIAE